MRLEINCLKKNEEHRKKEIVGIAGLKKSDKSGMLTVF